MDFSDPVAADTRRLHIRRLTGREIRASWRRLLQMARAMYSLSTCWNSHRHTDGRAMLREVRDLGFEYAELSHGTRISLVPGILEAVEAGEIKISTLHNFCPL